MSPLISAPNRGYADYQRTGNWDTGVLFTFNVTNVNSSQNSPLLDVSRFAYLAGFLACNGGLCSVDLRWWSDTALSALLGTRFFHMIGEGAIAQLRVPNLGPFITIQVNPIGGALYTADGWFTATNRVSPVELVPQNPVLISGQFVPLAANATAFLYPTDYYAGPVQAWYDPQFASGSFGYQFLDASGNWPFMDQFAHTALGNFRPTGVVPFGAWRAFITNSTVGASNFYLAVTGSTTGAT